MKTETLDEKRARFLSERPDCGPDWLSMESFPLGRHIFIPPPEGLSEDEWRSAPAWGIWEQDGQRHCFSTADYITGCLIDNPCGGYWETHDPKIAQGIITQVMKHPRNKMKWMNVLCDGRTLSYEVRPNS